MKNLINLMLCAVIAVWTSSCATTSPVEMAKDIGSTGNTGNTDQAQVNACLEWVERQEDKDLARYEKLSSEHLGQALMHRDTMQMITKVFGKDQNVCKPGTNMWDAYIVWAKEEGQTKRQYSSDTAGVAKLGILTTGVVKLADAIAGSAGDKIAGDKVASGRDTNQAGGDVTNSGSNVDEKNTNTQVQNSDGDATINPEVKKEEVEAEEVNTEEAEAGDTEAEV